MIYIFTLERLLMSDSIDKTTAIDALKTGLSDLLDMVSHVREAYAEDLAKKEYVVFDEVA